MLTLGNIMQLVRNYIKALSDEEKRKIIEGYNVLERDGAIGDEPIRVHTERFIEQCNLPDEHVVLWMGELEKECCRHFTEKWFKSQGVPIKYLG